MEIKNDEIPLKQKTDADDKQLVMMREWFILRFAKLPEQDLTYWSNWVYRFADSEEHAWNLMDNESQAKWNIVRRAYGFENFEVL